MSSEKISGTDATIAQLLGSNDKLELPYYQREYSWGKRQVGELIEDLTRAFLDEYEKYKKTSRKDISEQEERELGEKFRFYFLGHIIVSDSGSSHILIDGQQRVTTLCLLLIFLRRELSEIYSDASDKLMPLILTDRYGRSTFKLDVPGRVDCLDSLLESGEYQIAENDPKSIKNIVEQFKIIKDVFPNDRISGKVMLFFSDWLVNKVQVAYTEVPNRELESEIFETINERGLSLKSIEMLKAFLFSKIDIKNGSQLNELWQNCCNNLTSEFDYKDDEDERFLRVLLNAKYARHVYKTINKTEGIETRENTDYFDIEASPHKWVRRNSINPLKLIDETDYENFIKRYFADLSHKYVKLLDVSQRYTLDFEYLYYNSLYYPILFDFNNFSNFNANEIQFMLILATLSADDNDETFRLKSSLVSAAFDIFQFRRYINDKNDIDIEIIFELCLKLRDKSVGQIKVALKQFLKDQPDSLNNLGNLSYAAGHYTIGGDAIIRIVLARITYWLDKEVGRPINFSELANPKSYEIEHILPTVYDDNLGFGNQNNFSKKRHQIGNLVLLPRSDNRSYGAMPFPEKVKKYYTQNTLAKSLSMDAYKNEPRFQKVMNEYSLPFRGYTDFKADSINERQDLYKQIAEIIWDPDRVLDSLCP